MNYTKDLACIVFNYNNAHYLSKCLESIISQTEKYSYNIVIVDDCSEDNSRDIVLAIKRKYELNNVFFFSTRKNTGDGKVAALVLKEDMKNLLKTKYIYRIDSDDYITDNRKFEKQIDILENDQSLIGISHKYKILKNNTLQNNTEDVLTGLITQRTLIKSLFFKKYSCYNHTSTYIYRNIFQSILPPQFEKYSFIGGDVLYNWIFNNYGPIYVMKDAMSTYRIHQKGVWNRLSKKKKIFLNNTLIFKIFFILKIKFKIYFIYDLMKFAFQLPKRIKDKLFLKSK